MGLISERIPGFQNELTTKCKNKKSPRTFSLASDFIDDNDTKIDPIYRIPKGIIEILLAIEFKTISQIFNKSLCEFSSVLTSSTVWGSLVWECDAFGEFNPLNSKSKLSSFNIKDIVGLREKKTISALLTKFKGGRFDTLKHL